MQLAFNPSNHRAQKETKMQNLPVFTVLQEALRECRVTNGIKCLLSNTLSY